MDNGGINVNWVPGITLDEMEKNCILAAFRFYRGNKTHTANSLKISIRTLENKIEQYEADKLRETEQRVKDREHERSEIERMRGHQITKQFAVGSSDQWTVPESTGPDIGQRVKENEKSGGANGKNGNGAAPRSSVEPSSQVGAKPTMPVPQRKEVQDVLQRQASAGSKHRGR